MLIKKLITVILSLFIASAVFTGCSISIKDDEVTKNNPSNNAYYSFTDDLNNKVVLKEKPKRVISLFGSYAETYLLAGGELCGATEDVISERNIKVGKETKIIGTVKEPNAEELLNLAPDFVILSADIESHIKISETLKKANIPFAFFKVEHFNDYLKMLKICTDITKREDLYQKNGLDVEKQIKDVLSKIDTNGKKPTVLFIRAMSSKAKALNDDNMACKMLKELNTDNIASRQKSLLDDLSMETILKEDPDYIFVVTMGSSDKALSALKEGIQSNPAWGSLSAVKNNRYIVLSKELFHYKPNSRWGESYEYLSKIIYPDKFK